MTGKEILSEMYENIAVSNHAVERFNEATGIPLSKQYILHLALKAQNIEIREANEAGFRIDIYKRLREHVLVWMTMNKVKDVPLVYIFREIDSKSLLLVTVVYKRNPVESHKSKGNKELCKF